MSGALETAPSAPPGSVGEIVVGAFGFGAGPCPGFADEFGRKVGTGYRLVEYSLLDGMSEPDVRQLRPHEGENVTVVPLADGEEILLASARLYARGQECIERLEEAGARLIFPECAGRLPQYRHNVPYLSAFDCVGRAIEQAEVVDMTLGILIPSARQIAKNVRWYRKPRRQLVIDAAAPNDDVAVREGVARLEAQGASLIVMTCFLHQARQLEQIRIATNVPIVSSRELVLDAVCGERPALPHWILRS